MKISFDMTNHQEICSKKQILFILPFIIFVWNLKPKKWLFKNFTFWKLGKKSTTFSRNIHHFLRILLVLKYPRSVSDSGGEFFFHGHINTNVWANMPYFSTNLHLSGKVCWYFRIQVRLQKVYPSVVDFYLCWGIIEAFLRNVSLLD